MSFRDDIKATQRSHSRTLKSCTVCPVAQDTFCASSVCDAVLAGFLQDLCRLDEATQLHSSSHAAAIQYGLQALNAAAY